MTHIHTHRYVTIISEEKIINLRERGKEPGRSWKGEEGSMYIVVKFSKIELKKEHMLKS